MQAPSKFRRIGLGIAGVVVTTALASCGGSDDGSPPPAATAASNMPPASASANVTGFIAYLKTLVPTMPENIEPLDVANFVAPTDDTGAFDTTI